jgi:two-component system NtrC family sensor kinase
MLMTRARQLPEDGVASSRAAGRQPAVRFLVAALAACVVVPLLLLGYAAWTTDRDLHAQAEHTIRVELDVLSQHTLKVVQMAELAGEAMRMLTAGMTDEEIRAHEPRLHDALKQLSSRLPSVQSVWIVDRHGHPMVSDMISPMPPLDVNDRAFFQALRAADVGSYISSVLIPKIPGAKYFSVSQRRLSADGGFNGIVTVSLLPIELERFYRQLDPEGAHLYSMVRTDGAVLARVPHAPDGDAWLAPSAPLMQHLARRPDGDIYTAVSPLDGVHRMIGYRPVPGFPLVVTVGTPLATIRAEWLATLEGHLLFGGPATLLLLITLLIAIRRTRGLYVEAERRRVAEAALSRTQRLEAIGQLTGGVAHDFNNLLMIIRGSAERLRRRHNDATDLRSIEIIDRAVQRGATLTRQLLTFASRQALAVEVIDLSQHLSRFSEVLRRSLRGDIHSHFDLPGAACMVNVDPGELELALLNIAVNARDAMPNGGCLGLRVYPVTLDGSAGPDAPRGSFIAIAVRDSGVGIAPDHLARVFEPFFTTKPTGKGTGLGLSQVYGFARQSGGTVAICSDVGHGTEVTIYLPATALAPRSAPARPTAERAAGAGRRLLMVEDTAEVAEVMRGLLQDAGYRVDIAASAAAALERLDAGDRFDIVVSDIIMPGDMKGIDLARELRRRRPDLPVVLTSGYSDSAEQAIREGFAFVQKPYEFGRLRDVIEAALGQRDRHGPTARVAQPARAG